MGKKAIREFMVLAAGRPAQAVISSFLEDSGNGKVQKASPKGIYKGELPWATKVIISIIFTVKRNVLAHFWHVHFVIWELGWPGFPSET